jgi:hypothetical protein
MIDDLFAKQSENTSRLDFRSVVAGGEFTDDGVEGMKRTVISRSVESTKPIGGVVWAPSGCS